MTSEELEDGAAGSTWLYGWRCIEDRRDCGETLRQGHEDRRLCNGLPRQCISRGSFTSWRSLSGSREQTIHSTETVVAKGESGI